MVGNIGFNKQDSVSLLEYVPREVALPFEMVFGYLQYSLPQKIT